jgi:hypothetical protein
VNEHTQFFVQQFRYLLLSSGCHGSALYPRDAPIIAQLPFRIQFVRFFQDGFKPLAAPPRLFYAPAVLVGVLYIIAVYGFNLMAMMFGVARRPNSHCGGRKIVIRW